MRTHIYGGEDEEQRGGEDEEQRGGEETGGDDALLLLPPSPALLLALLLLALLRPARLPLLELRAARLGLRCLGAPSRGQVESESKSVQGVAVAAVALPPAPH